jgi:hypothetical protein
MEKVLHNVAELPLATRAAVEELVGHALNEEQRVFVAVVDAPHEPLASDRLEAWDELRKMMDAIHAQVRASGTDVADVEWAIDQACDKVRYGG